MAEGLGNREIGERLFIAQKTVSVHCLQHPGQARRLHPHAGSRHRPP
ncbi:LuxR C-terminal-related transcriptional regulator [Nonomuraea dietziae]